MYHRPNPLLRLTLCGAMVAACRSKPDHAAPPTDSAPLLAHPVVRTPFVHTAGAVDTSRFTCLRPDSLAAHVHTLAFGEGVTDTLTQDVEGEIIHIVIDSAKVRVLAQEAAGEWGKPHPVDSADISLSEGTIRLRVDADYSIVGRFNCDSLWGDAAVGGQGKHFAMHRVVPF